MSFVIYRGLKQYETYNINKMKPKKEEVKIYAAQNEIKKIAVYENQERQ